MAETLQDILRRRQQEEFVGREEQLIFFRRNLRWEVDDPRRRFVINVTGQGGVGKTWLLRRFRKIAEEFGTLTAYTDEAEDDVPNVMGRIAEHFAAQGCALKTFAERYKVYRQRRQEIEADPEALSAFPTRLGRALAKGGLDLAHIVPVGGVVAELVHEETFVEKAGEFAAFVASKVRNRDEVHLVLEPVEVLTPLLLHDLRRIAEKHPVAFFFDTYERTGSSLDPWLRGCLEGRHGEVPANITLVVGGRDELDRNLWTPYEGLVARLPLDPFTEEEARGYLARKGVTDERVVEVILRLSGRLPLLVATLAAESPEDAEKVGDPSGEAVERFLKWVDDPEQRRVALDAALPRLLNRDVLAVLVEAEKADALFFWLREMPFVEKRGDGWAYHDVVRAQMLRYKCRMSPQGWADLHRRLADYYEGLRDALGLEEEIGRRDEAWQEYQLEVLYHRLCQSPRQYLPTALTIYTLTQAGDIAFARSRAETICAAGTDAGADQAQEQGQQLLTLIQAFEGDDHQTVVDKFTALLGSGILDEPRRARMLAGRGGSYMELGMYTAALADYERSLELDPSSKWTLTGRGTTYRRMKRYQDAIADFSRAIELEPDSAMSLVRRGETYRIMGSYDKALSDLNVAVELQPNLARAVANRGETYRLMERYEDALTDLNRAIELQPDYTWAFAVRGVTYSQMGRFDNAVVELNHAIEFEPDQDWIVASRAEIYRRMGRYGDALADFDRAIAAQPNYAFAFSRRGATHMMMGDCDEALADLNRAVELESGSSWTFARRAEVHRRMGHYEKALTDFNRSIELKPDKDWSLYGRALTYQAQGREGESQADLAAAIQFARQRCERNPQYQRNRFRLALYHLAAEQIFEAERLYREALSGGVARYDIRKAVLDLEAFLASFSEHSRARAMRDLLQEHLQEVGT